MTGNLRGFKALSPSRGSLIIGIREWGYRVYSIRECVKPLRGCGPLCVFSSKNLAKLFLNWAIRGDGLIVPCFYGESTEEKIYLPGPPFQWKEKLPFGTVLADWVTCLE